MEHITQHIWSGGILSLCPEQQGVDFLTAGEDDMLPDEYSD